MAASSSRIELLSKDNYDTWCMQVEALLTKNDLWDYVDGTNKMPTTGADVKTEWLKADKKAKSELIMAIQPSELKQVRGCETSRAVWLKLESIYASKGPARKATLLKQLILQRLEDGGDVKEHMATFFDAVDKLENMNVQIHGDLMSIMLLYSLPSSFENFRCAIESRDELPTAEVLKVKIVEENEARKHASGSVVTAMAAGNRGNVHQHFYKRGKGKDLKNNIKCFKCGTVGHKANVCPMKKTDDGQWKSKQSKNGFDKSYVATHMVTANVNSVYCAKTETASRAWILDSGCTRHLCGDKNLFKTFIATSKTKLNLASQASAEVKGKGVVHVSVANDSGDELVEFKETLYVPDLRTNLISVAKITDKGHEVTFRRDDAYIRDERGNIFEIAVRQGDLYVVRESLECAEAVVQPACSELLKWHERLGHLNSKDLAKLVRDGIIPKFDLRDTELLSRCEVCLKGKMTVLPFKKGRVPCAEKLKIVHSDVVGPFRKASSGGAKYFVTFIDDSSRWCEVYFLRRKSGVFEAFKLYQKLVEKQTGKKVKCIQSDNGGEYCNEEFNKYLADQGIERRLSTPHTPQQNGVAERMNRTLLDMSRCLLLQSGMGATFWSEAIATACHIRNRCPTNGLNGEIPFVKWTGKKLKAYYLRKFGSKVLVLNKDPRKDKLAQRSVEGVFVGYSRGRKGYRVWMPNARKFIESRDLKFLENTQMPCDTRVLDELMTSAEKAAESVENRRNSVEFSPRPVKVTEVPIQPVIPDTMMESIEEEPKRTRGRPRLLRTGNRGRPRKLFGSSCTKISGEENVDLNINNSDNSEDDAFAGVAEVSVRDALRSEACDEWKDAMESEVISLVKNDTWEIVKKDDNKNIVGCRWVLTNKHDPDGKLVRRKARLVAKGYNQKYGVDYHQTFAPVARLDTLRLLLAIAVQFGLKVWQFDVVTAYLNGSLDEEVTMVVPEMLNEMLERILFKQGETSEVGVQATKMMKSLRNGGDACKLKKALYGLKQAGRQWYFKLSKTLVSLGLEPMKNEPCLFHGYSNGSIVLVLVYVDDILVASREKKCIVDIYHRLLEDFEIKDLGLAKYCLGFEIDQSEGQIGLFQTGYILGLLKQYGMDQCNSVVTPSEVNVRFDDTENDFLSNDYPYRELIGGLMYLSVGTRPDISNTVSRLAQFTNKPRKCHWIAAKRVLRYLASSANSGLVYTKANESIIGYTDADWGGCIIDRRSYTGYAFIFSGAAITWKSQKQRTVALSSTEAEYVSLAEAAKEALYLRSSLCELGLNDWSDIVIYVDNRGAQFLANDPVFHARTKHIDIKHHFVRESISAGMFVLEHVPTEHMIADVLTKPLSRVAHERCLEGLGFGIREDLCE